MLETIADIEHQARRMTAIPAVCVRWQEGVCDGSRVAEQCAPVPPTREGPACLKSEATPLSAFAVGSAPPPSKWAVELNGQVFPGQLGCRTAWIKNQAGGDLPTHR